MTWVLISLLCAFSEATQDALKKNTLRFYGEYLVAWVVLTIAAVFLLTMLFFVRVPNLDRDFYIAFGCALPLEVTAVILYTKALKKSPLSLTLPFLALTPAFLLITPFFILGETIKLPGLMGVLALTCGAYLLNLSTARGGIFEPFHAIRREKGSMLMIIVAAIYSLTASLGKRAIEHSSALFFMATYVAAQSVMLAAPALFSYRRHDRNTLPFNVRHLLKLTFLPGVLLVISSLTHSWAIQLTQVAYMISVKRLSLLIGVVYGWLFFKEKEIRERLLGAVLMLLGFILIVLFGH
jgi:drug/metabolite transporter (DMT)-like permease